MKSAWVCQGWLEEIAGNPVTGIVDEHVDGDVALVETCDEMSRRIAIGEVAGHDLDLDRVLGHEFVGEALQAIKAACAQHQIDLATGQFTRKRGANSGRGAGDEGISA